LYNKNIFLNSKLHDNLDFIHTYESVGRKHVGAKSNTLRYLIYHWAFGVLGH